MTPNLSIGGVDIGEVARELSLLCRMVDKSGKGKILGCTTCKLVLDREREFLLMYLDVDDEDGEA